jgi:hypothetical protein
LGYILPVISPYFHIDASHKGGKVPFMKRALLWLGVVLLAGCSGKTLHVESNTTWAGNIDKYGAVAGQGNAAFDLGDIYGEVCWKIGKTAPIGVLRAYSDDDTWFGLGSEVDGDQTTTLANGEVTGCSQ